MFLTAFERNKNNVYMSYNAYYLYGLIGTVPSK